uniref:Uncharacterized protein n=1 Tax=Cacopsylla melanoneura TaxID=428564 RepID=A0A8D8XTN7_9HEMI
MSHPLHCDHCRLGSCLTMNPATCQKSSWAPIRDSRVCWSPSSLSQRRRRTMLHVRRWRRIFRTWSSSWRSHSVYWTNQSKADDWSSHPGPCCPYRPVSCPL